MLLFNLNSFFFLNKVVELHNTNFFLNSGVQKGILKYFLFKNLEKQCNPIFFKKGCSSASVFFFKKFIYFFKLSVIQVLPGATIRDNTSNSLYYIFLNTIRVNNGTRLNLSKAIHFNKGSQYNMFNMLYLCSNLTVENTVPSNYNLLLLKQYINNFNKSDSTLLTSANDIKIISKKFVFFEFFLKKFLENIIKSRIFLTFVRNDMDFILSNQYYLMFIKRIKKLQVFNKDINLVRELVEVLVITMYTFDVVCFKNWLVKVAEKIHFKLHKRLFYVIKIIIAKYFNLYFKYFGCLGFCLRVQGKIGLGGSSKTRSF
jgi:hypothetical protein